MSKKIRLDMDTCIELLLKFFFFFITTIIFYYYYHLKQIINIDILFIFDSFIRKFIFSKS